MPGSTVGPVDLRVAGRARFARGRFDEATADLDPPLAVLDLDALDANAADLVRRAGGKPVRVASKSVRSRAVLRRVLARPGFAGILAYSLPEALWLSGGDDPVSPDEVVAYPRPTGRRCAGWPPIRPRLHG